MNYTFYTLILKKSNKLQVSSILIITPEFIVHHFFQFVALLI